jgi:hypothetical protein
VADGADWIWDVPSRIFPEGEEIFDDYHCAEHVYACPRAQYGGGTVEAREWAEAAPMRLSLNELGATIGRTLAHDAALTRDVNRHPGAQRLSGGRNRSRGVRRTSAVWAPAAVVASSPPTS